MYLQREIEFSIEYLLRFIGEIVTKEKVSNGFDILHEAKRYFKRIINLQNKEG